MERGGPGEGVGGMEVALRMSPALILLTKGLGPGELCSFHRGQLCVTQTLREVRGLQEPQVLPWYQVGTTRTHETRNTCNKNYTLGLKLLFLTKAVLIC